MKNWKRCRWIFAILALNVTGCAMVNDKAMRLVSSKVSAVAIVNTQLLRGDMVLLPDRSGTLSLSDEQGAISTCSGQVRLDASTSGVVDLRCNDGSVALVRYSLLSDTRGYGYGTTATGSVSLAFGMVGADAQAYLRVPATKKLRVNGDGALELQ